MSLTIGVVKEPDEVERRVALVPDGVQRLRKAGLDVVVQRRAGAGSWCLDELPAFRADGPQGAPIIGRSRPCSRLGQ